MDYPIQVPVTDFAQLALDVYEDPDANDVRPGFNKAWAKLNSWTSMNQFHATFYKNMMTNVGVLAIRGTVPAINKTVIQDLDYFTALAESKDIPQYHDALSFYNFIENYPDWKNIKEKYVCGHSLGGMLAKAIAPITGFNTIAFNSPSITNFLLNNHYPVALKDPKHQKQLTYAAKNDFIGNLLSQWDLGKYVILEHPKELDTPENNKEHLFWHSMKRLYTTLKNGIHRNDKF